MSAEVGDPVCDLCNNDPVEFVTVARCHVHPYAGELERSAWERLAARLRDLASALRANQRSQGASYFDQRCQARADAYEEAATLVQAWAAGDER